MSRHRRGERVPTSSVPVCVLYIHTFPMCERSVISLRCIRISGHPVRTLTGRCIRRRPLTGSRAGNNNFECSSRGEIDTDTKRTYGGLDEDRGDEPRREGVRENEWARSERERERETGVEIYVTGESASIACCKRAGSCPLLATLGSQVY